MNKYAACIHTTQIHRDTVATVKIFARKDEREQQHEMSEIQIAKKYNIGCGTSISRYNKNRMLFSLQMLEWKSEAGKQKKRRTKWKKEENLNSSLDSTAQTKSRAFNLGCMFLR